MTFHLSEAPRFQGVDILSQAASLGPVDPEVAATDSNATIENTTLANIDGEKTGLDALGTTVTMTGVSVTSTAGGVKLIDSDASLASVSIRAGTIALTHRARSEFPELKATDIDLNGDMASMLAYAQAGFMFPRDSSVRFYADFRAAQGLVETHLDNGTGVHTTELTVHAGFGW